VTQRRVQNSSSAAKLILGGGSILQALAMSYRINKSHEHH
jgi:hypothetical protein